MTVVRTDWKIGEAKQRFSEVIRLARRAPQRIHHREHFVAAVIGAAEYAAFERWRERQPTPSLEQSFSELRDICAEERYTLPVEPRRDRVSAIHDDAEDDDEGRER